MPPSRSDRQLNALASLGGRGVAAAADHLPIFRTTRPKTRMLAHTAGVLLSSIAALWLAIAAANDVFQGEKYPVTRTKLMSSDDIAHWSFAEVRYAINEIYARHGYDFPKKDIKRVFLKYRWYRQRLTPGRSTDDIEGEFNEYETENLKLLGQLRDELASGGEDRLIMQSPAGQMPTTSVAGAVTYTPPEIHAWIGVQYSYTPLGRQDKEEGISATERENLPASQVVTHGSEIDRIIEGSATIAPLRCSIHLTRESNRDTGTLTVNVVDTVSGRVLEGFPVSSKNAVKELKERDSVEGSEATDFVLNFTERDKERLADDARKWVVRDEGEDRGKPEIQFVALHIALGPPIPFSP